MVETLHIMPQMVQGEDGYNYPPEMCNKLYVFKDQYVFIKEKAYDSFPKGILDNILPIVISQLKPETDVLSAPSEDIIRMMVEGECAKIKDQCDSELLALHNNIFTEIKKYLEEHTNAELEEYINRISGVVSNFDEKFTDRLDQKASIETLTDFNDQLIDLINKKITNRVADPTVSSVSDEHIKELVVAELKTVYDNMERIISEKALEHIKALSLGNTSHPSDTKPVSVAKLAMLKESGFTVDEIIQLIKSGTV